MEILDGGLPVESDRTSSIYKFKSISGVKYVGEFLVIIVQNTVFIPVPKSAFCEFSADEFKGELKGKINSAIDM